LPGQVTEELEAEVVNDAQEWRVEEILSLKVAWGKLYYQVRWKGWDPDPQ